MLWHIFVILEDGMFNYKIIEDEGETFSDQMITLTFCDPQGN